jgi:uncharacterized protein (DUF302 family)
MSYYINTVIETSFDDAVLKVIEHLKNEGFGVLTEIDIQEILKNKTDVDFRKYTILGACNPPSAYKALISEPHIGLMLPCNIVIQKLDNNKIDISAINPKVSMQSVNNSELESVAEDISSRLERVIKSL